MGGKGRERSGHACTVWGEKAGALVCVQSCDFDLWNNIASEIRKL